LVVEARHLELGEEDDVTLNGRRPTVPNDRTTPGHSDGVRVVIADDQAVVREGLRLLLEKADGFEGVGCASSCGEVLRAANCEAPDVVVLDAVLGGEEGLVVAQRIKLRHPAVGVLLFPSDITRETLERAVACGVNGVLLKTAPLHAVLEAIADVSRGDFVLDPDLAVPADQSGLTPREREVLRLLADGLNNRQISQSLFISLGTAKRHLENIARKLGTSHRAAAVAEGIRRGLVA